MTGLAADRARIEEALAAAAAVLQRHRAGDIPYTIKRGHGPVTAADHEVDDLLRELLPRDGEGWLSEESVDDHARLACRRVWVVDPIDGTRSFIAGRPEYSISIGLVVDGEPVLGGVCNPATGVTAVGGPGEPLVLQGDPVVPFPREPADGLKVLASRTEARLDDWQGWRAAGVRIQPISSVAYKLLLVAAGAADATWTIWPKSEWDIAAGTALVRAAGGDVWTLDGTPLRFNRAKPVFGAMAAAARGSVDRVRAMVAAGRGGS